MSVLRPANGVRKGANASQRVRNELTESRCILSSFWRGTMVTCSISHKKATSEGTSPVGRGRAILY